MFVNPETEKDIVTFLATRNAGYTRREISAKLGFSDGGRLSHYLNALIASDFIVKYVPFGMSKKEEYYKVVDPYCLFYLHFAQAIHGGNESFWQEHVTAHPVVTWRNFAFENVCFTHVRQIKRALGVSGVITSASAWSKREDDREGTQIDLLLSRNDNVMNMCEIKYYGGPFTVKKDDYLKLLARQEILAAKVSPRTTVRSTLITTYGLTQNEYSGVFTNVITLDDLFAE